MLSLSTLPVELLEKVLGFLQAQCQVAFAERNVDDYFIAIETLRALSLVQKSLQSIATKFLYRTVILESWNSRLFLRTILASVQYRSYVRHVSLNFQTGGYATGESREDEFHPDPPPAINDDFQSLSLRSTAHLRKALELVNAGSKIEKDFELEDLSTFSISSQRFEELSYANDELPHVQEEIVILLFLLPNLNSVQIDTPEEDPVILAGMSEPREAEGLFRCKLLCSLLNLAKHKPDKSPLAESLPAGFRHLQEIVLHDPYQMPGKIKAAYPPIIFWPLDWLMSLLYLPELKKVRFDRCFADRSSLPPIIPSKLSNTIQEMEFTHVLLPVEIIHHLTKPEHCRNLKSFVLTTPDFFSLNEPYQHAAKAPEYLSPKMIVEVLHSQKENLEQIRIQSIQRHAFKDLADRFQLWVDYTDDDEEFEKRILKELNTIVKIVDLSPFSNLHTAIFHITDFTGIRLDYSARLSDLLPPSLRNLYLTFDPLVFPAEKDLFSEAFSQLAELLADKKAGKIAALRLIKLNLRIGWYSEDTLETLRIEARQQNVNIEWEWHKDTTAYQEVSGAKRERMRKSFRRLEKLLDQDPAEIMSAELDSLPAFPSTNSSSFPPAPPPPSE
ncbi:MAG: hypothetical protein Q9227_004639 [Pyrenula ochraceoflavens]